MEKLAITKITKGRRTHVYDLNVQKNHNFYITNSNILTHNCDGITPDAGMALKSTIESLSKHVSFILTTNHYSKLDPAIISRCPVYDFRLKKNEQNEVFRSFAARVVNILKEENVGFDKEALKVFLKEMFPKFRDTIKRLQSYAIANNQIDSGIIGTNPTDEINGLIEAIRDHDFMKMWNWVLETPLPTNSIVSFLYKNMGNIMESASIPEAVSIINTCQFQDHFVVDKRLNLVDHLIKLGTKCKLKK